MSTESLFLRFLRQFKDWIIILLLVCAAITAYLGDALTSGVLLLLVLVNTSIGFFQEYRSGKTMDALQHLSLSLSQVMRDGRLAELDSTELVVGDVVRLTEGASVPADVRLIEASAFSTNGFALTGESDPTRKYTHAILTEVMVAERHNTALAKRKALVKRLSAVETLGSTQVICTDKTGTLSKNEMTVTELVVAGRGYVVRGIGYDPAGSIDPVPAGSEPDTTPERDRLVSFLRTGALASNARLLTADESHPGWHILGDPTEGALLTVAAKAGIDLTRERTDERRVREFPFDSTRKLMTAIRERSDGTLTAYVKGAPESVVARASHIDDGETVRLITDADREAFLAIHTEKSDRGLRNLAYAIRAATAKDVATINPGLVEKELILLGMVSMVDPIRDDVPEAMRRALDAGIRVNIVTGDFSRTAEAIARDAGLDRNGSLRIVTGEELLAMSNENVLAHALFGGTIFSRVDPEDKTRIVDLVKRSGHVVAVTGDGINDAPALRHASIGVAMGESGTDVAKEAAEIVLLDDSFSTLVRAVEQGRVIYANISKGVLGCLTSNAAELVVNLASLILATLAGLPLAINVLQILAIDLLGELLPIAALGRDAEQGRVMNRPPRDRKVHIVNPRSIGEVMFTGSVIGVLAIGNFLLFFDRSGSNPFAGPVDQTLIAQATTMTYVTVLVCQLFNITQRRSEGGLFTLYTFSNPTYWLACAAGVGIMLAIVYVPWMQLMFKTGPLGPVDWAFVLAGVVIFVAFGELARLVRKRLHRS